MRQHMRQEWVMEHAIAAQSDDSPDIAQLLRALAAARDWPTCCAVLHQALPRLLPATRLDIYATDADGVATLRFTSAGERPAPPPLPAHSDANLRKWTARQGYPAIITVPLPGVGRTSGWLVLARRHEPPHAEAARLADQIAPAIALWLRYDHAERDLELAAQLDQRLHALDALQTQATLASGTAHDIGNLLTSVLCYAQLLADDAPAVLQDDIRMIIRAAEDGRHLLRRLHDASPVSNTTVVTPLAVVIEDAVRLTRPIWAGQAGVRVELVLEAAPVVRVPDADLREVLINLILNAVAAMPTGGTITIRCAVVGERVELAVTDTGHGIAREYQQEIFQPFVTTRADGSGLGLSVSRAIVEGHGGTLTVESEPGRGATFTITLPM